MEGQFRTEACAPLRVGGLPNERTRQTRYALEIPGGLSWLAYGAAEASVRGLDDFPAGDTPPVAVTHVAFQIMVLAGTALAFLGIWAGGSALVCRRIPKGRWFLGAVAASGPLVVLAMEAGWVVTEVGRQPWIVQGVMRTEEAVTGAPGLSWLGAATLVVYTVLISGTVVVLRVLARAPGTEVDHAT
jgi:cytochrome d ubiquinol oxidase subunit I